MKAFHMRITKIFFNPKTIPSAVPNLTNWASAAPAPASWSLKTVRFLKPTSLGRWNNPHCDHKSYEIYFSSGEQRHLCSLFRPWSRTISANCWSYWADAGLIAFFFSNWFHYISICQAACDTAFAYAHERKQFNTKIGWFWSIQSNRLRIKCCRRISTDPGQNGWNVCKPFCCEVRLSWLQHLLRSTHNL